MPLVQTSIALIRAPIASCGQFPEANALLGEQIAERFGAPNRTTPSPASVYLGATWPPKHCRRIIPAPRFGMKRYRVIGQDFDTRASILRQAIDDAWEPKVKETCQPMHGQITSGLAAEFGPYLLDAKIKNLVDLGPAPFSIISFHNRFLRQARSAFVIGAYYPALTGACALGERILNHLS